MNEVDHWHDALGELKNAFKDESTMSNIAVSDLIVDEEDMEGLENIDDQVSFHSTNVADIDKYKVEEHVPEGYKDVIGQPGMLDVTDEQEPRRFDAAAELNHLTNLIKLDLSEMKNMEKGTFQINVDDEESVKSELQSSHSGSRSGSGSGSDSYSSRSDGSLLFNAWNEDFEGNPDPDVLKRLLQTRSLPRGLDPYIKIQIKRAKIIQKLQELEDDISSKGSCEMMFDVVCGPRFCGNDSDAGTADTNSLVLSIKEDDSFASLDTTDFMFRKPQKSPMKYSLTPDSKYKPTEAQSSFSFGPMSHDKKIPVQKLTPPPFGKDDKSEGTYEEKEMEFTLQNFEGLFGNTIPREINVPSDASDEASINSQESDNDNRDEDNDYDLVALRMKRVNEDDDSVLDDRSVMSPSEAAQYANYMRTRLMQSHNECAVQKDTDLEYFLQLFSNPDYKAPTVNEDGDVHHLPQTENNPEEAPPSVVINGEQSVNGVKIPSIASTFDASLNPIESNEYQTVPCVVKPTNQPQRFISELSCASDVQELSTCSDQALFKAAPLIESSTTLLSSDSFATGYREVHGANDVFRTTLEDLSVRSDANTIESASYSQPLSPSSDRALFKAAPLIESATTLLSSDSFVENDRVTDDTKDLEDRSVRSEKETIECKTSKDSVDLLMDALDLNLQTTTTFPSSEGEEFVVGLPVDGILVNAPQSKFGRIISPEEFDALQTIKEISSYDSDAEKQDVTHDNDDANDTENNTISSDPLLVQEIPNEKGKKTMSVDTATSNQVKPSILSPSSTSLHNKLGEIEKEFKEISEELNQIERDEEETNSTISKTVSVKSTLTSPRGNKPIPLSPRNIQSEDSPSTNLIEKMKDDLSDLKSSISKKRAAAAFDFSTVES